VSDEVLAIVREVAAREEFFSDLDDLELVGRGEVHRARVDETLDAEARAQAGRVARHAIAWDGPPEWLALVDAGAVPDTIPLTPMPLPEGYRDGSALQQLPQGPRRRLAGALQGWAFTSEGATPPHRIRLWREEVAHARLGRYHLWVALEPRQALIVAHERSAAQVAGGVMVTVLGGVGAGGFGLLLGPAMGVGAFVFGASLTGVTVGQALRRRFTTAWLREDGGS
tara:strand:- start:49 stop:726 length:678 start_codon:yes stop_codon:yes gene_type:complete